MALLIGSVTFGFLSKGLAQEQLDDLSQLRRLKIEGLQTHKEHAILRGLFMSKEVRAALHPYALREPVTGLLAKTIKEMLLHAGHAEAEVESQIDYVDDTISVRIKEGPRYMAGQVEILGADEEMKMVLRKAILFSKVINWSSAEYASFAPHWPDQTRALARSVLAEHGFLEAEIEVHLTPRVESKTADLRVEVVDKGKRQRVVEINVEGHFRSSKEAILTTLEISPGMVLTGGLVEALKARLEQCANFPVYEVTLRELDSGDHSLRLYLEEDDVSSELGQKREDVERALDALVQWINHWTGEERDLRVHSRSDGVSLTVVFSGDALAAKVIFEQGEETLWHADMIISSGRLLLLDHVQKTRLSGPLPRGGITSFVRLTYDSSPESKGKPRNDFQAGAGFSTKTDVPFSVDTSISPIIARRYVPDAEIVGDNIRVTSGAIEILANRLSGEAVKLLKRDSEERFVEMTFEKGALLKAVESANAEAATYQDLNRLDRVVDYLLGLMEKAGVEKSLLIPETYLNLVRLTQGDHWRFLEPLQAFLEEFNLPENILAPPPSGGIANQQELMMSTVSAFYGYFLASSLSDVAEKGSWPERILRGVGDVIDGNPEFVSEALKRMMQSHETGPFGHLVLALMLEKRSPRAATEVARVGLTRLNRTRLRFELRALSRGDALLPQMARMAVNDLVRLPDSAVNLMGGAPESPESKLLTRLREFPFEVEDGELPRAILDVLVDYADRRFIPIIRTELRRIAQ